jgi:hypothetical protein
VQKEVPKVSVAVSTIAPRRSSDFAVVSDAAQRTGGGLGVPSDWDLEEAKTQEAWTLARRAACGHLPGGMPSHKKEKEPSEEEILHAFRACPLLDLDKARQLIPEVMAAIEPLADSLCVHWQPGP